MADVENRDELERQLSRKLGKLQKEQLSRLLDALGEPPKLESVPQELWDELGTDLQRLLAPFLQEVYLDQARGLMLSQPVGVDWGLVNQEAVRWASEYTYRLVTDINNTSRRTLRQAVSAYFEKDQTRKELEQAIVHLFGPTRSEMIAVTEITRASVMGEQQIAAELRKMGIEMIPVWQTNNDERVCSICGPLHDQDMVGEYEGVYPPAHPRCRCWLNHRIM